MRKLALLAVMAGAASTVSALWDEHGVTAWPVSYCNPLTPGYIVNDIYIHCDAKWLGCQLYVVLTDGAIYQHPTFSQYYPQPEFWGYVPDLQWDSVVTDGQNPLGSPSISGGAVDLGGAPSYTHNTSLIDIGWFVAGSEYTGDLLVARTTLSGDARGTWSFLATASCEGYVRILDVPILMYLLPEPATLGLLALGSLGLIRRRR